MDVSKFKPSDWLKVGGGALMLIAYFLPWWGISGPGFSADVSGSQYFFTGTVPWLLLVAIGVLSFLAAAGIFKLPASLPAPLIFLGVSVLTMLLIIVRFFSDGSDISDSPLTRGAGLYLALVAAIAVLVGCGMGFKESGGSLADLKDPNKLKGAFQSGQQQPQYGQQPPQQQYGQQPQYPQQPQYGQAPPPPPGGYQQAPPPPPGGYQQAPPPPPPPGGGGFTPPPPPPPGS